MASHPVRNSGTIRPMRRGRVRWAPLVCALMLAIAACGASPTVATSPTHTPTPAPSTPAHGVLYAFAGHQASTGPTSSDVYALGLSDGKQVWHAQVSGGVIGAVLGGGALYLGATQGGNPNAPPQGMLEALNASTGVPLWHHTLPAGQDVPLAADGDAVFASALMFSGAQAPPTNALTALNAHDGTPLWSVDLGQAPGEGAGGVTLGDGVLYLASFSAPSATSSGPPPGVLTAIDTHNGAALWHMPLQSAPTSAPVLNGGVLYLSEQSFASAGQTTSPTSVVLAVRASDGKLLWSTAPPAAAQAGGIVVTSGTVCYSYSLADGPSGGIVALHAADGSPSWQAATQAGGSVPLAADSSAVYALDSVTTKSATSATIATTLLAFDASSGKALLTHSFPTLPIQVEFGSGTPIQVVNGVLYTIQSGVATPVATATGQPPAVSIALALNARDGSVLWQQQFNGYAQPAFVVAP